MTISGAVMQGGQALSPDGALYVKLDSGSAITGTTITATTAFQAANGAAATPSYNFTNFSTNGFYSSAGKVGVSVSGASYQAFFADQMNQKSTSIISWSGSTVDAAATLVLSRYADKQLMISGDGTGAVGTNVGWIIGNSSSVPRLWTSGAVTSATNWLLQADNNDTFINAPTRDLYFYIAGAQKGLLSGTAGSGLSITAGTAADNTPRALSISQTWTDGTSSNIGIVGNFDMGATGTATGKLLSLRAGAAGTTEVMSVDYLGAIVAPSVAIGGSAVTITAVNSVSPTAPNRTITISYGGTTYYLAAKTTND